jgi:hypothetical protein
MDSRARCILFLKDKRLVLIVLVGVALALLYAPFSYDEAYITFRYAVNLSQGKGFVFNPGERYLGTTGYGWAILLALLRKVLPFLSVAGWSSLISGLILLGLGIAVYLLARSLRMGRRAWLLSILVMANPLIIYPLGGEVVPQVFLLTLAWWRLTKGDRWSWGILAGLATWMRGDGTVALLALIGTAIFWNKRLPWGGLMGSSLVLLPWMIFNTWYFGQPWPSTLPAKTAQCQSGLWICFGPGLFRWVSAGFMHQTTRALSLLGAEVWTPLLVGIASLILASATVFGAFRELRSEPRWWPMLLWPVLHSLSYIALQAPFYPWYATVVGWGLGLIMGLGIIGWMKGRRLNYLPAIALILIVTSGYGLWHFQHRLEDVPDHRQIVHSHLAAWFQDHAPPGSSIMGEEIGFLGYYLPDYRIYDTWGLITPGVAPHLLNHDLDWVVRRYCPDYFLAFPEGLTGFRAIPLEQWFRTSYIPVAQLQDTGLHYAPTITIYYTQQPCPARSSEN